MPVQRVDMTLQSGGIREVLAALAVQSGRSVLVFERWMLEAHVLHPGVTVLISS